MQTVINIIAVLTFVLLCLTLAVRFFTLKPFDRKDIIAKIAFHEFIPDEEPTGPLPAIDKTMITRMTSGNSPQKQLSGYGFIRKSRIREIGPFGPSPMPQPFPPQMIQQFDALRQGMWVIKTKRHTYVCFGFKKTYDYYQS